MSFKTNSQNYNILKHLQKGKSLTCLECFNKGWGANLRSRISNLKAKGYNIETKLIKTKSGYHARYSLKTNKEGVKAI